MPALKQNAVARPARPMTDQHDITNTIFLQRPRSFADQIRDKLHGDSSCPRQGALGELCVIESLGEVLPDGGQWYSARIYIWNDEVTAAQAAGWFKQAGAVDVEVFAQLHDEGNGIVEGRSNLDGVRPWDIKFRIRGDKPPAPPPATIRMARYHWQGKLRQLPADRLLDALALEDGAMLETLSITFATVANPHAAAPGADHGN